MTWWPRAIAPLVGLVLATTARGQAVSAATASLDPASRATVEQLADSLRREGLPVQPLYAKVAEGKLKQATDGQIVQAVRALARRFRDLKANLGAPLEVSAMTAAATALSAGVPIEAIRNMRDAATGAPDAGGDFAGALVTLTDLVAQRVSTEVAVSAVQSLLVRRAPPDQFARLRISVGEVIASGRAPDQAVRTTTEAIVKTLPGVTAPPAGLKPPNPGDVAMVPQVSPATVTPRNPE